MLNSNLEKVGDSIELNANVASPPPVIFEDLESDTYYYVEVETYIYRNNVSLTDKISRFTQRQIIYTSSTDDISLGSNVSLSALTNSITLSYNGFSNLDKIAKIHYSLRPTQTTTSSYPEGDKLLSDGYIFNFNGSEATFTVDLKVNNKPYSLVNNKKYDFTVQYYTKDENGEFKKLFDQNQVFSFTFKK